MARQTQSTHHEGLGSPSPGFEARLAEVAASREPITTIGERVEYFDVLLLDIDWLASESLRKELTYARRESASRRGPLPVVGLVDVSRLAKEPAGYPVILRNDRRAGIRRDTRVARPDDQFVSFTECAVDTETGSGKLMLESKTLFDRGWDQMPRQKYVQFYDQATDFKYREAHILYEAAGQGARMLETFFSPKTEMPLGYRRLEVRLFTENPGRIPPTDPFLNSGNGELTRLRHHAEAGRGGGQMGKDPGARETISLCDTANAESPSCEIRANRRHDGRPGPPYSLRATRMDPLSGVRLAKTSFRFEEPDSARPQTSRPPSWSAYFAAWLPTASSVIEIDSLSLYNFQTGDREAKVRSGKPPF